MKVRLSDLLNNLNISLETASKALKSMGKNNGGKEYSLNTAISEENTQLLTAYINSESKANKKKKKRKSSKSSKPQDKTNSANGKQNSSHVVTSPRGFSSCLSVFRSEAKTNRNLAIIKEEMDKLFGEDVTLGNQYLFREMAIKQIAVQYKYYYFSLNGRKTLIRHKCLATWMASIFSEAVNKEMMTKVEYYQFFRKHLSPYFKKVNNKPAKKRPWVSIVSVPFGGMNKR